MQQTEQTAIVLRTVNYRDNDRMLTLLSPVKGRMEIVSHGCRRPRSPLLNASEVFALGDFELYTKNGHSTLVAARLIETFHPLREDYERLCCGMYLLNLCELAAQPMQPCQDLFMLLLHTLSRLTFSDQPWRPLLCGFLLHYSVTEGFRPRLNHCLRCGKPLAEEAIAFFDTEDGGLCCAACHKADTEGNPRPQHCFPMANGQREWLRRMLETGASGWVEDEQHKAPWIPMRRYVETRLEEPPRSAAMLPVE